MRKRINRAALCSSNNYYESRKLHKEFLKERHSHFNEIKVSGEISIDVPVAKHGDFTPKYRTIKVFGKEMTISIEEYNIHCKELGL